MKIILTNEFGLRSTVIAFSYKLGGELKVDKIPLKPGETHIVWLSDAASDIGITLGAAFATVDDIDSSFIAGSENGWPFPDEFL